MKDTIPYTLLLVSASFTCISNDYRHDNMSAHRKIYRISNMAKLKYMKNYTYIQIDEDVEQYRY